MAISSVTAAYGRNNTLHGDRSAVFVEGARHADGNTLYGRFEAMQVETSILQTDAVPEGPAANLKNPVFAFTVGGVRDIGAWRGFEGSISLVIVGGYLAGASDHSVGLPACG